MNMESGQHGLGRRHFLRVSALTLAGGLLLARDAAIGQQPAGSAGAASAQLIEDLVAANRILADQGVVDGYGHVSVRHDKNPNRYLISRSLAPALVTADDIIEYDLDSRPVDPRGRQLYSEVFIHGEIYKLRPDVNAVVHSHAPSVIALGIAGIEPRPVYHMSSFIGLGVPVFDIRKEMGEETDMLVRTAPRGEALARILGRHPAALMRGHGAVIAANALPLVVFRSIYLQINSGLQLQALTLNRDATFLTEREADLVEKELWDKNRHLRAWDLWKQEAMGR
jgi:ribulose-5-phosphate 4-epimerase/fuculose-1-phosphate aldolase